MATLSIEIAGQEIQIPCSQELLKKYLLGQISDQELIEGALKEAPEYLIVKQVHSPMN